MSLGWSSVPCLLLTAVAVNAADLVLVQDGQPKATIVTAADAGDKVRLAATELQSYLQRMSGARLPLATAEQAPAGPLVLVGPSPLAAGLGVAIPSGVTPARREEGYVIACRGDRLLVAGNVDGPYHGTEFAVYDVLRRLGVRWFMPGPYGEYVPQRTTLTVPELQVAERPDFVMRNWWLHAKPELGAEEKVWKLRNRMTPEILFAIPGDSSARNIVPPKEALAEHPDWFALNADGSRNPHLPNLTSQAAVDHAATVIKEWFRTHPGETSYGFAPDDGLPRDFNPDTVALNQGFTELGGRPGVPGEASTSEEWFSFVNRVAAAVRKDRPEVYLATNGYANRDFPPQGMTLDDHLVVMFAAIWSCTLHAYDDPRCWQKERQGQMLQRWTELCPNVWIYGYNYQMLVSGLIPLPETRKMRRDFPLMKRWGVLGFHDEARNVWAECGIASRYLRAQLEWDAEADVDAVLADFYRHWYGAAAEPMRAWSDAIEEAIERSPMHGHEDRVMPFVYTPELLAVLQARMAEAERLADSDRARLHVRADRLITDHLAAYLAMNAAEAAGEFATAAAQAGRMLELRGQLHAINPFYVWPDENGYHTGIWYWGAQARQKHYQLLADRTSGQAGDLVALLPARTAFRTDAHDEGLFARWYRPTPHDVGWSTIDTTRPFYTQGYVDGAGHPFVGHLWYRFRPEVAARFAGRKVMLHVPTLETEAWVWVNGQYIGHRRYREAYERPNELEMDITAALKPGAATQIDIRVGTSLSEAQAASGILSRVILYAPKEG